MSFQPSPILLFAYNRPSHLRKTVKALAKNTMARESNLIIYSDGARDEEESKKVQEVREYCKGIQGFAKLTLIERETNLGLAQNIIQGVSEGLKQNGKAIVLEDDLLTHPAFLTYMNGALNAYANTENLLSVSAYLPPRWRMPRPKNPTRDVWLNPRNLSFGWGTWSDKWASVDWEQALTDSFQDRKDLQAGFARGGADLPGMLIDQIEGRLDSWAVRFSYAHYRSDRFSLMPADTYVKPIGFDGSGIHCRPNPLRWLETTQHAVKNPEFPDKLEVDQNLTRTLRKSFDRHHQLVKRF
jgi:glycosyltransferase involved in cell wall biosynthesis